MQLTTLSCAVLLGSVCVGCLSGEDANRSGSREPIAHTRAPLDLSGVGVDCSTASIGDVTLAMQRYDDYFAPYFPDTDAKFEWYEDASLASAAIVDKVFFYNPPTGLDDTLLHQMFSFDETLLDRPTNAGKMNFDIWDQFNSDFRGRGFPDNGGRLDRLVLGGDGDKSPSGHIRDDAKMRLAALSKHSIEL